MKRERSSFQCPFCNGYHTGITQIVKNKTDISNINYTRRKRICRTCHRQFSTYEFASLNGYLEVPNIESQIIKVGD